MKKQISLFLLIFLSLVLTSGLSISASVDPHCFPFECESARSCEEIEENLTFERSAITRRSCMLNLRILKNAEIDFRANIAAHFNALLVIFLGVLRR